MSQLLDNLIEAKLKRGILSGDYVLGFYNIINDFESFTYYKKDSYNFIVEIIYIEFDTKRDGWYKFSTSVEVNLKAEIRLNKLMKI
jgi:hypothetical protein